MTGTLVEVTNFQGSLENCALIWFFLDELTLANLRGLQAHEILGQRLAKGGKKWLHVSFKTKEKGQNGR